MQLVDLSFMSFASIQMSVRVRDSSSISNEDTNSSITARFPVALSGLILPTSYLHPVLAVDASTVVFISINLLFKNILM